MELLAPGGNQEKIETALRFGADAVYVGGENFSLRNRADNFSIDALKKAVDYVHSQTKKIYLTVNIYARNADLSALRHYFETIKKIELDAWIVSDPGIIALAQEIAPHIPLHLSTQANTTNWSAALFWQKIGIQRIILARELSLPEIQEIKSKTHVELETFVHGSMCMAYSGRCMLSNFLTTRDANRGDCAQPCRWEYTVQEAKRPGEFFPVEEDEWGTYIFNSRDLNLLSHIPQLAVAGVHSIKIEGRMKSHFYLATVVRAYREAIDLYTQGKWNDADIALLQEQLNWISNRSYTTAFFIDAKNHDTQNLQSAAYQRKSDYLGEVLLPAENSMAPSRIAVRGKFSVGDEICLMAQKRVRDFSFIVEEIWDENHFPLQFTKPNTKIYLKMPFPVKTGEILHRLIN